MEWMEPDWEDLDRKSNMIIARYAVVSGAWNILPPPLDMMGVAVTFGKMATELAGVYQVIVSPSRAQKMGWAIATTTASVMGVAYAGSKIIGLFPAAKLVTFLVQAPIVSAVAWAAGETLRDYFKETRKGREPGIASLRESFAHTLRIKLKNKKIGDTSAPSSSKNGAASDAAPRVSDAVDKIALLHELLRAGAITQEEFESKKAELLKQV